MGRQLLRERAREGEEPALGRGVRGVVGAPDVRELRAQQDDAPAALRDHDARRLARAEESAAQVHGHHPLPVLQRHVGDGLRLLDAGVVDEHVETTEALHDAAHERAHVRFARDVAADGKSLAAASLDFRHERARVRLARDPRDRQVRAFFRVRERDAAPDARVATRDERDLAGEPGSSRAVELLLHLLHGDGAVGQALLDGLHVAVGPVTPSLLDVDGDPAREHVAAYHGPQHLRGHAEDRHELGRRCRLHAAGQIVLHERTLVRVEPADAAGLTLVDGRLAAQRSHAGRDGFGRDVVAIDAALGEIDPECHPRGARRVTEGSEDRVETRFELGGGSHRPYSSSGRGGRANLPALLWRSPMRTSDSASVTAHATGSTTTSDVHARSAAA